jgi:hypothetical protein
MWHEWKTGEVHTRFWWGNVRDGDRVEDNIKMIFKK